MSESLGKVRTLYGYAARNENELSFESDVILDIVDRPDDIWWLAKKTNGDTGLVPCNYIDEIISLKELNQPVTNSRHSSYSDDVFSEYADPAELFKAAVAGSDNNEKQCLFNVWTKHLYNAQNHDELSFDKNIILEILDKPKEYPDWWQARNKGGVIGLIPSNYVEEIATPILSPTTIPKVPKEPFPSRISKTGNSSNQIKHETEDVKNETKQAESPMKVGTEHPAESPVNVDDTGTSTESSAMVNDAEGTGAPRVKAITITTTRRSTQEKKGKNSTDKMHGQQSPKIQPIEKEREITTQPENNNPKDKPSAPKIINGTSSEPKKVNGMVEPFKVNRIPENHHSRTMNTTERPYHYRMNSTGSSGSSNSSSHFNDQPKERRYSSGHSPDFVFHPGPHIRQNSNDSYHQPPQPVHMKIPTLGVNGYSNHSNTTLHHQSNRYATRQNQQHQHQLQQQQQQLREQQQQQLRKQQQQRQQQQNTLSNGNNFQASVLFAKEQWYHGRLTRTECEKYFQSYAKVGEFLVRESESTPGDLSLSLKTTECIKHYKITRNGQKYIMGHCAFRTMDELVRTYNSKRPIYTDKNGRLSFLWKAVSKKHFRDGIFQR